MAQQAACQAGRLTCWLWVVPAHWHPLPQLDPESLNRKRAAHVLKAALSAEGGGAEVSGKALPAPWATFFKIFDSLEDFSMHLVQVGGEGAMWRPFTVGDRPLCTRLARWVEGTVWIALIAGGKGLWGVLRQGVASAAGVCCQVGDREPHERPIRQVGREAM